MRRDLGRLFACSLLLRVSRWAPPFAGRPFLCREDSDSLFGTVGWPRLLGNVRHRRHLRRRLL